MRRTIVAYVPAHTGPVNDGARPPKRSSHPDNEPRRNGYNGIAGPDHESGATPPARGQDCHTPRSRRPSTSPSASSANPHTRRNDHAPAPGLRLTSTSNRTSSNSSNRTGPIHHFV